MGHGGLGNERGRVALRDRPRGTGVRLASARAGLHAAALAYAEATELGESQPGEGQRMAALLRLAAKDYWRAVRAAEGAPVATPRRWPPSAPE